MPVYGHAEMNNLVMAGAIVNFERNSLTMNKDGEVMEDPRNNAMDNIPEHMKKAFSLPPDM